MKKLVEYFLPDYYYKENTDLQRRMRLAVSISLAFFPLILLYLPLFIFILHNVYVTAAALSIIVISMIILFLLRRNKISFKLFAHTYICLALCVHTTNVCTTGGTGSVMLIGYLILPLTAALLLNRHATFAWSAIGLLAIIVLGILERNFGLELATSFPSAVAIEAHIVLATAVFMLSVLFILLMQSGLDSTLSQLHYQNKELSNAYRDSESLLLNILPSEVAHEIKTSGRSAPRTFSMVTVMFTDFKDFTSISQKVSAELLVSELDYCFSAFDRIIQQSEIEKIKTIGDSYMCASGLPVLNYTHAHDMIKAAMEIKEFIENRKKEKESRGEFFFEVRIGIHTGPVVAGIVGVNKYSYDIWGDTVNIASRMEGSGQAGKINISGTTYELIKDKFKCLYRGKVYAKNKGEIDMYFVEGLI